MIQREIDAALPELAAVFEQSVLGAELAGQAEVLAGLAAASATASGGPPVPPQAPQLPDFGPHERVRFPVVDDALRVLEHAPQFAGENFMQTAAAVKRGAFAVTGDLADDTIADIQRALQENIAAGADQATFLKDVSALLDEGTGLSEARLEMVFRTNVQSQLSDAAERAVSNPLVADEFPYRLYMPTRDNRVRPGHLLLGRSGLEGTAVYRADDPLFLTFRPPWDYNCRCSWAPVTVESAARLGVKEAQAWVARAEARAEQSGGSAALHIPDVAPASPQFVPWPQLDGARLKPAEGFTR